MITHIPNNQKSAQLASTLVMVPPDSFSFNKETSNSNSFQQKAIALDSKEICSNAMEEFHHMVKVLRKNDLEIILLSSNTNISNPDSIFPNNWFSHHENGELVIYPMLAINRRAERQVEKLVRVLESHHFIISEIKDLSYLENKNLILEGTGSMVLDREHKVAFALESSRTSEKALLLYCQKMGYDHVFFHAYDKGNLPIYHTNVFMSIGKSFAVVCLEAISNEKERVSLVLKLKSLKKSIVSISIDQLYSFCGNILNVQSLTGESLIILSQSAFNAYTQNQKKKLSHFGRLIPVLIDTIEYIGGGSARCMLAEIFT